MTSTNSSAKGKHPTDIARISARELVVTRLINGPVHLVFQAWSEADLFRRWWVPASFGVTLLSCERDVRTGGRYRLEFAHPAADQPMAFFGRYLDVVPNARIVWTNEEGGEAGPVTTATFEDLGDLTRVKVRDLYPSEAALDEAIESGSTGGWPEQLDQLDDILGAGPTM